MKPSILVLIILRLFAINWAFMAVVSFLFGPGQFLLIGEGGGGYLTTAIQMIPFATYALFAFVAWKFAGAISRKVVGSTDPEMALAEVRPENLYTLGLLGIGMYFALANLGGVVNWLHYLAVNRAGDQLLRGHDWPNFYDLSSALIPCGAGVVIAIMSPKLGRKLARRS